MNPTKGIAVNLSDLEDLMDENDQDHDVGLIGDDEYYRRYGLLVEALAAVPERSES